MAVAGEGILRRATFAWRADPPPRDERELIRAAQRGSEDAIERLVRAHWRDAYRLALGVTGDHAGAEDCAQEGLLAAVRGLDRFDAKRPFAPWLHRIVLNRALDLRRSRTRRAEAELEDPPESPAEGDPAHDLSSALGMLDDRARAVVVLKHVLGHSAQEIADIVETSEGNVRSILSRSLAKLREALEPAEQTGG